MRYFAELDDYPTPQREPTKTRGSPHHLHGTDALGRTFNLTHLLEEETSSVNDLRYEIEGVAQTI